MGCYRPPSKDQIGDGDRSRTGVEAARVFTLTPRSAMISRRVAPSGVLFTGVRCPVLRGRRGMQRIEGSRQ